ncbi:hypothetical protein IPJ72_04930 [Candidatus Peregrinibacteria bacterium]|nr:MAG: hypothetical protein IPJ72_04930 [Candidatus Peregrinibacteria bacterium]
MKIFFLILAVFVGVDILMVGYVFFRRRKKKISQAQVEEIKNTWRKIIRQTDMRHAILDADKLLDHALFLKGYRGSLGNKLKKAAPLFKKNINKVWAAHKVRNNIAHQINYQIDEKTYKEAMTSFKQAFIDLKIF